MNRVFGKMGAIVLNAYSELDLIQLKEKYDNALKELSEFLDGSKTYKDMTVEEFKQEVRLFWERSDIWRQALENGIYSKVKLDEDFELFKMHANRLLL